MRWIAILIFFTSMNARSQDHNVISFRDKLVAYNVLNVKSESVNFKSNIGQSLQYKTAEVTGFGFGMNYKWLSLEYTKRVRSSTVEGLYGHTENFGFGFGVTKRKWYFRNFYEEYNGYHMTNPDFISFNYLDSVGHYPYRPDMTSSRYLATCNWIFDAEHYSSMASLWQLERQIKSAGSFVAGLSYGQGGVSADSAFIPSSQIANFSEVSNWRSVKSHSFGVNLGYHYTFVFGPSRKWFVHLALSPGLGLNWSTVYNEAVNGNVELPNRAVFLSEDRFIAGYNGDKWYFGFSSILYTSNTLGKDLNPITKYNNYNRIYFGYRFTLPSHTVDALKKIGL